MIKSNLIFVLVFSIDTPIPLHSHSPISVRCFLFFTCDSISLESTQFNSSIQTYVIQRKKNRTGNQEVEKGKVEKRSKGERERNKNEQRMEKNSKEQRKREWANKERKEKEI